MMNSIFTIINLAAWRGATGLSVPSLPRASSGLVSVRVRLLFIITFSDAGFPLLSLAEHSTKFLLN
jgi:hypothetical protein